jgi:hypothetical protein
MLSGGPGGGTKKTLSVDGSQRLCGLDLRLNLLEDRRPEKQYLEIHDCTDEQIKA